MLETRPAPTYYQEEVAVSTLNTGAEATLPQTEFTDLEKMIKGNIEIFQSYGDTHKSLYTGSNMVVDGFRKTIADVMTYMPNPSGAVHMEVGTSSVSSYQIQAMEIR